MTAILRLKVLLFLGFTLFAADAVRAQPTPIDLGTLGGSFTFPSSVNNRGQVVGTSTTVGDNLNTRHAFLWTETTGMVDLGTFGGATSSAADVNNRGAVVGSSRGTFPLERFTHAFLWTRQDGMVDLQAPSTVGLGSFAILINDRERVIGAWDSFQSRNHVFTRCCLRCSALPDCC